MALDDKIHKRIRELGIEGYDGVEFGKSRYHQNYPSAVLFAERDGGRLQSLRDAVVYRVASNGEFGSALRQYTRDFALYFRLGGVNLVAFVDGYDFVDRQNRSLISRRQEGYAATRGNRRWYLPFSEFSPYRDDDVGVWLDELVETGLCKTFNVKGNILTLRTKKPSEEDKSRFYFGNYHLITGLLTPKIAEAYSEYLSTEIKKSKAGADFILRFNFQDIPAGRFLCHPIFLNDKFNGDIRATGKFVDDMYVRGVFVPEREVSNGNS